MRKGMALPCKSYLMNSIITPSLMEMIKHNLIILPVFLESRVPLLLSVEVA